MSIVFDKCESSNKAIQLTCVKRAQQTEDEDDYSTMTDEHKMCALNNNTYSFIASRLVNPPFLDIEWRLPLVLIESTRLKLRGRGEVQVSI